MRLRGGSGEATVRLPGGYGAGLEDQATRGPGEMLLGGAEARGDRPATTVVPDARGEPVEALDMALPTGLAQSSDIE